MQGCASVSCADTPPKSRSCWQRGRVSDTKRRILQLRSGEPTRYGFPVCSVFFPSFDCSLSLPSSKLLEEHLFGMLEGSSEAWMSQPFSLGGSDGLFGLVKALGWVVKFSDTSGGQAVLSKEPTGQVCGKSCLQGGLHMEQELLSSKVRPCSAARGCHSGKKHEASHQLTIKEPQ